MSDSQQMPDQLTAPRLSADPVCLSAAVVAGAGESEVLQRIVLDLGELGAAAISAGVLPGDFLGNALEVVVLSERLEITDCEVFPEKVLVNGMLHKNLLFKLAPVDQPDFTRATLGGGCPANSLTVAQLLDISIDCPVDACVSVPGACPGDQCVVDLACVDASQERLIDLDGDGLPEQFEEKVCMRIRVSTIGNRQVSVTPSANRCPQFLPPSKCPATPCLSGTQGGVQSSSTVRQFGAVG